MDSYAMHDRALPAELVPARDVFHGRRSGDPRFCRRKCAPRQRRRHALGLHALLEASGRDRARQCSDPSRAATARGSLLPASAAGPGLTHIFIGAARSPVFRPLRRRLLLRRRRRNAAERLRLGRSLCSRCRLGRLRSGERRLPDRRLCARRRRPRCARRRPHARQALRRRRRDAQNRGQDGPVNAPAAALCQGRFQLFLAIRDCRAAARPKSTIHRARGHGLRAPRRRAAPE